MHVLVSFLPLLRDVNPVIGHLLIFSYTRRWLCTEEGTRASKPGKAVLHLGSALCPPGDLRQVTWLPSPVFSHLQRGLVGRCNGSSGHLLHTQNALLVPPPYLPRVLFIRDRARVQEDCVKGQIILPPTPCTLSNRRGS